MLIYQNPQVNLKITRMNRHFHKSFVSVSFQIIAVVSSLTSCSQIQPRANPLVSNVTKLIADKKIDEAEKIASESFSKTPNDSSATYVSALVDIARKNYDSALEKLNRSIEANPRFADAYSARSLIQFRLGFIDSAMDDANHAIDLDDTNALAYHRRALIELRRKQYSKALEDLNATEKLDPHHSPYYLLTNRGDAELGLNNYAAALKQYSQAVPLAAAGNTDALLGRALCQAKLKNSKDCLADSHSVLATDKTNGLALALLAVATSQQQERAKAVSLFKSSLAHASNAALFSAVYDTGDSPLQDLTTACLEQANPARAIWVIKDIDTIRPLEVEEQVILARAYAADGQLDRAAKLLSGCLATQPDQLDARIELIRIYGRQGLSKKAHEIQVDGLRLCKGTQARNLLRIAH